MGGALCQHGPALSFCGIEVVYLEGDAVIGMRDAGAQILFHRTVLGGPEHEGPVMHPVVHRQHHRTEPSCEPDPADLGPADQVPALRFVQFFYNRLHEHGSTPAGAGPSPGRHPGAKSA
jgi:hypothetical protein